MKEVYIEIGQTLKNYRLKRKLSLEKISNKTKISIENLSNIEILEELDTDAPETIKKKNSI
mgnify:CR=1 FL=1